MNIEQTELRAERLRVTVEMFGIVQTDFDSAYTDAAFRMSNREHALFQSTDRDDLSLSNACLDVQAGIRRRDWAALERLLGAIPPGGGLDNIFDIPADECITALHAAVRLGWHWPGSEA